MNNKQQEQFNKKLGKKVYKLRKKKRLSLRGLGKLADVSGSTIGLIEKGTHTPNSFILFKLSKALNVPVEELTDGTIETYLNEDLSQSEDPIMKDERFEEYINIAKKAYYKNVSPNDLSNAVRILNARE
ncbi:MAG: helix-turn-helix domain-containing protein [bacterium]